MDVILKKVISVNYHLHLVQDVQFVIMVSILITTLVINASINIQEYKYLFI